MVCRVARDWVSGWAMVSCTSTCMCCCVNTLCEKLVLHNAKCVDQVTPRAIVS